MRELCFKIKLQEEIAPIKEDILIDEIIDFALQNKVSVGGNFNSGFCFCVDHNNVLPKKLKTESIRFFRDKFTKQISEIKFKIFNESVNMFTTTEIIKIDY
ncbi:hypothetical protein [uncultured Psychroserpens sp.]|uniref:hypothetical protein n=1 Tax=uncultured Psychroserpens sp. TaxID=255436 RepID=UPI00261C71A8|nr:hypothetical protein [uncultured Psychroserpens sp.]